MVKLLNLREADIYLRTVSFLAFFEQLRKSVVGLRPKYDINVRGSANNIFALLTGNTTPDGNFQLGLFLFSVLLLGLNQRKPSLELFLGWSKC